MYSKKILERFSNPAYAGGIRGGNGTGKVERENEVAKIYLQVDEDGTIKTAKFKAYGGVCTIAVCDVVCSLIEDGSLSDALALSEEDIVEELGSIPANKQDSIAIALECVKLAVEDYYDKKEKELKKASKK